jgi:hypothetical protein
LVQNGYPKEVAINTHPWGREITIHICYLGFHIDFSSIELIPKNAVPLVVCHDTPFLWALALCL